MAHYRILKQVKKVDDSEVIITVAMVDSQNEVVEFSDDEYDTAVKFVELMNANTSHNLKYFVEKVN